MLSAKPIRIDVTQSMIIAFVTKGNLSVPIEKTKAKSSAISKKLLSLFLYFFILPMKGNYCVNVTMTFARPI